MANKSFTGHSLSSFGKKSKSSVKKPKYKALPKAPKMSASIESWKKYEQRVREVTAENLKKKAAYEKAKKEKDAIKAYKEKIKERAKAVKF